MMEPEAPAFLMFRPPKRSSSAGPLGLQVMANGAMPVPEPGGGI